MLAAAAATLEEREALRESVRKFLRNEQPPAMLRRLIESETGFDGEVWDRACRDLGLAGLAISEAHDGIGLGLTELAIVMEEMGRALACTPYLSSAVLAAGALTASGDAAAMKALLPQIAAGRRSTLAFAADGFPAPTAQASAGKWLVNGQVSFVVDGATSDVVLVAAEVNGEAALFLIEADANGLLRTPQPTLDLTRRLAAIELQDVPGQLVGIEGDGARILREAKDRASVALAAEMLGGARACLEMSVDYARTRFQFGRQIGSFQAIKHRCSEMMLAVEMAAAALACALEAEGSAAFAAQASLAKAICGESFARCAVNNIQIHGGIGFTWEHDAHLYFRRAKASQALLGDTAFHRERYAQLEISGGSIGAESYA